MIAYDDLMNGSSASPSYTSTVPTALAAAPKDGFTDTATASGRRSSPRAVLVAWSLLFLLLVMAHVLTLSVQR